MFQFDTVLVDSSVRCTHAPWPVHNAENCKLPRKSLKYSFPSYRLSNRVVIMSSAEMYDFVYTSSCSWSFNWTRSTNLTPPQVTSVSWISPQTGLSKPVPSQSGNIAPIIPPWAMCFQTRNRRDRLGLNSPILKRRIKPSRKKWASFTRRSLALKNSYGTTSAGEQKGTNCLPGWSLQHSKGSCRPPSLRRRRVCTRRDVWGDTGCFLERFDVQEQTDTEPINRVDRLEATSIENPSAPVVNRTKQAHQKLHRCSDLTTDSPSSS